MSIVSNDSGVNKALLVRASRAGPIAFVADVWPLAQEDPDVAFWAQELLESGRGSVPG